MLEKLFFVLKYVTCNRLSCDITIVTKTMHYLKVSSEEESDMWLNVLGKCVSKEEVLLLKHLITSHLWFIVRVSISTAVYLC